MKSEKDQKYNEKKPNIPGRCDSVAQRDIFKKFRRENNISLAYLIEIGISEYKKREEFRKFLMNE